MIVCKKEEQKGFQQLTAAIEALKKKLVAGVAMALVCYTQRENGD